MLVWFRLAITLCLLDGCRSCPTVTTYGGLVIHVRDAQTNVLLCDATVVALPSGGAPETLSPFNHPSAGCEYLGGLVTS